MRLPGADQAVEDPIKVRDYLLSLEHPVGRRKARFFQSLGFTWNGWPALQPAFLGLAQDADATKLPPSHQGQKYEIRAVIVPSGSGAVVVTIWIVLAREDFPRLVTAYPGEY